MKFVSPAGIRAARSSPAKSIADHWQVIVIGAGVAGGLAALNCARAGWKTLLVERQTFPREKVCGCCLNQQAIGVLQDAGLLPRLRRLSPMRIRHTRFHVHHRSAVVRLPETWAISRAALDGLLVEAFVEAGGEFRPSTHAVVLPLDSREVASEVLSGDDYGVQSARVVQLASAVAAAADPGVSDNDVIAGAAPGDAASVVVTADVVLACDGLGHRCLTRLPQVVCHVHPTARIGLGTVVRRSSTDSHYPEDELQMAVSPCGYVGTAVIENDQLNIAAAIDGRALRAAGSPQQALREIYASAGLRPPDNLSTAHVRGTLPLTRTTSDVAFPRLLLLGDAAGYVEPFTGEGMTWALTAAARVPLIVSAALEQGWNASHQIQWQQWSRLHVKRRQRMCRLLSGSLRYPWLLSPMLNVCHRFPGLANTIVTQMNHSPTLQEQF